MLRVRNERTMVLLPYTPSLFKLFFQVEENVSIALAVITNSNTGT
jgi:hypothetical protein